MKTDFFSNLITLLAKGNSVVITAKKTSETEMTLAVINHVVIDEETNTISPISISGNTVEIDEKFFEIISTPAEAIKGLQVSTKEATDSIEELKEDNKPKPVKTANTAKKKEASTKPVKTETSKATEDKPSEKKDIKYLLMDAHLQFDKGEHKTALELFQNILAVDPKNKVAIEKIDQCNKWIARKADLFGQTEIPMTPKEEPQSTATTSTEEEEPFKDDAEINTMAHEDNADDMEMDLM